MMPHRPIEILAPAGDEEMLRAAVFSGADCVYVGVKGFNARRSAANFDAAQLAAATAFCRARGVKVYAALNTLMLPGEEDKRDDAIASVAAAGCDAVIVQDLGIAARVKKIAPTLPMHASTQLGVHSRAGVEKLAELGFSRVILARELEEKEIAALAQTSPIELEVFVHGALCVSVSGQCWMSAFLGGRSANRGACAGPCRLPCTARQGSISPPKGKVAQLGGEGACHHLSLKDLSILNALPRLQKMGVAAAKIEGRLRGPEYVAGVVDAAKKVLNGEKYDAAFIEALYSRSGFTDGWFTGRDGREMFGTRTEEDIAATRKALPKARELYRREMPRVPVDMALVLSAAGAALAVTDGENTVEKEHTAPLQPAQKPCAPALQKALEKTGGTPFYLRRADIQDDGLFLPTGEAAALRADALGALLALREAPRPHALKLPAPAAAITRPALPAGEPVLRARFEKIENIPPGIESLVQELVLPLEQAEKIPLSLRGITRLWLPRVMFGRLEEQMGELLQKTAGMGFLGCEADSLAHLRLCHGQDVAGGFGLNIANAEAAAEAVSLGCGALTLSPEVTLREAGGIAAGAEVPLGLLCYGHLPVMTTRACPLLNAGGCAGCPKEGLLRDRKGMDIPVVCRHGVRMLYNPLPLWMADRLAQWPVEAATLYFTSEPTPRVEEVLLAFAGRQPADTPFTRGLYEKGLAD